MSYPVSDFAVGWPQAWRREPVAVLDVRRRLEWASGHIEGALHLPLHYLPGRVPDPAAGPGLGALPRAWPTSRHRGLDPARGFYRAVTAIDDSYDHAADARACPSRTRPDHRVPFVIESPTASPAADCLPPTCLPVT